MLNVFEAVLNLVKILVEKALHYT